MTEMEQIIARSLIDNLLGASAFAVSIRLEIAETVARALEEAAGGPDHLVQIQGQDWVVQHPLHERFEPGGLIACKFTELVAVAVGQGAMGEGTHRVTLDRGVLLWDEISCPNSD